MPHERRYKDVKLVEDCARELGLSLRQFEENDKLKLYFNVFRGEKELCCIYKGPDDPGFRIMEDLTIDKTMPSFKDKFLKMYEVCSKHLVSMVIMGNEGNTMKLCFEIGIYQAGFNSEVLKMAISDLEEAMDEIKGLLDQFKKRF